MREEISGRNKIPSVERQITEQKKMKLTKKNVFLHTRPVKIAKNQDILNNEQTLVLKCPIYASDDVKKISRLLLRGKPRYGVG